MSKAQRQADAFVRDLEARRERHCEQVLSAARAQAREIVKQAFREVRQRAHVVVADERDRLRKQVRAAEARLLTVERRRQYQALQRLLEAALGRLPAVFEARWREPELRRRWVDLALEQALRRLPRRQWTVAHHPNWAREDIEAVRVWLSEHQLQSSAFQADPNIRAGLRVSTQGVVLDATIRGLTSDRRKIEARLLALLDASQTPAGSQP